MATIKKYPSVFVLTCRIGADSDRKIVGTSPSLESLQALADSIHLGSWVGDWEKSRGTYTRRAVQENGVHENTGRRGIEYRDLLIWYQIESAPAIP